MSQKRKEAINKPVFAPIGRIDALPALQGLRHGLIIAFGKPSGQQFAPILRHFLGGLVVLTHRYLLSGVG